MSLLLLLLLLPAPALSIGPSCKDTTWSPVFFRAVGDLFQDGDCTRAAASSCPFPATPETWISAGPVTVEVGARCLSASTYAIIAGLVGDDAEVGPFATSTCVRLPMPIPQPSSVKMSCKPGLLLFAVPAACVLAIIGCVCCCRAGCCCRPQAPPAGKAAFALVPMLQQQQQQQPQQQQPLGFYGGPLPPPQWGGYSYAPPQQQQPGGAAPPQQPYYAQHGYYVAPPSSGIN